MTMRKGVITEGSWNALRRFVMNPRVFLGISQYLELAEALEELEKFQPVTVTTKAAGEGGAEDGSDQPAGGGVEPADQ